MNKSQVLDRIRNRLTMPRALLQILVQLNPQCEMAIDQIDGLIKEIEKDDNETSDQ